MTVGLSDFITRNNAAIVDECEAFARTLGPAAEDMDREALRDHLGGILEAIAADMKRSQSDSEQSEKSKGRAPAAGGATDGAAETHGALRAASGFDVNQTASEYRALRASVARLWLATAPTLGPDQVAELIRFNEAMDQALAETLIQFAAAAAKARNLFLGVLSHELRTPLGTILGSAQALERVAATQPEVAEVTGRIVRGSRRIQSLLDDLLDYVRSGSNGGMRVTPATMHMDELCERLAREVEAAFPGSRIELRQEGGMTGSWDEQRIAQAISNLMSNAIKYGAADTAVRVGLATGTSGDMVVEVHNEGPQIPPETLESLFQPLVRAAGSDDSGVSLGLGLFIVREIALAHGGAVDVDSTTDEGTIFRLRLPRGVGVTKPSAFGRLGST